MTKLKRVLYKWRVKAQDWVMRKCRERMDTIRARVEARGTLSDTSASHVVALPPKFAEFQARFLEKGGMTARFKELCEKGASPTEAINQYFDELFWAVMFLWWYAEKAFYVENRNFYRRTHPPGAYMGWIAETFFTAKTRDLVIETTVADYRLEVRRALEGGDVFRERYLTLLYGIQFLKVAFGKWIMALLRALFWWY